MHTDFYWDEQTVQDVPDFTLHPVKGVVWAGFWGSPVAAGIVMAINYARMGRTAAAVTIVPAGVVLLIALVAVVSAIPDDVGLPNVAYIVPQLLLIYAFANGLQGDFIRHHAGQGGRVASVWPSVGIGVLCLPLVLGAFFGAVLLIESSFGTVVRFANDEIYYSGDATEQDARKLARILRGEGYFGSAGGIGWARGVLRQVHRIFRC